MLLWEGYHKDGKIPIIISVSYDYETEEYVVEVVRGFLEEETRYKGKHKPSENGLMHISDMERSVKCANNSIAALKKRAIEENKRRRSK